MNISALQQYLQEQQIDLAFFIYPDPSIIYFTEMEPSHALLSITPKSAFLWLTALDKKPITPGIRIHQLTKASREKMKDPQIKKVGLNYSHLTLKEFTTVKTFFPNARFIDITETLCQLRKEKNSCELQYIRKACHLTCQAFAALIKELPKKTLQTEVDIATFLENHLKNQGAEIAFPTIAAIGKNAATPHHKTSRTQLSRGFLIVDFGAKYKNYCADMTRVIFLGTSNTQEKKWYKILLNSQMNTLGSIRKNISFMELDKIARKHLNTSAHYFIHSLGHGIGIEVHEAPLFADQQERVEKNVPFTIEPGIYIPGKLGLRIEDTVIWNGKNIEVLTKAEKKLMCIPF